MYLLTKKSRKTSRNKSARRRAKLKAKNKKRLGRIYQTAKKR
jgi:hypothetical protein